MANKVLDCFQGNAGNWIYLFISDEGLAWIRQNRPKAYKCIAQKRLDQQKYVTHMAQETRYNYAEIKNAVGQRIKTQFGKTPGECLTAFLSGKTVKGVNGYTVGGVKVGTIGIGIGAKINENTGVPVGSTIKADSLVSDDGKYEVVYDCETEKPLGVYKIRGNGDLGRQVSYYDETTGRFKSGSKASNEFWSEACGALSSILTKFLEWLGSLFGVKEAAEISSLQSDGWVSSKSTTNTSTSGTGGSNSGISMAGVGMVAAGVVALAMLAKGKGNSTPQTVIKQKGRKRRN